MLLISLPVLSSNGIRVLDYLETIVVIISVILGRAERLALVSVLAAILSWLAVITLFALLLLVICTRSSQCHIETIIGDDTSIFFLLTASTSGLGQVCLSTESWLDTRLSLVQLLLLRISLSTNFG